MATDFTLIFDPTRRYISVFTLLGAKVVAAQGFAALQFILEEKFLGSFRMQVRSAKRGELMQSSITMVYSDRRSWMSLHRMFSRWWRSDWKECGA